MPEAKKVTKKTASLKKKVTTSSTTSKAKRTKAPAKKSIFHKLFKSQKGLIKNASLSKSQFLITAAVLGTIGIAGVVASHAGSSGMLQASYTVGCTSSDTIKLGSKGPCVVYLQNQLNFYHKSLGLVFGTETKNGVTTKNADLQNDGNFGDLTATAVKAFQTKKGLKPYDGIVGPKTWAAIGMPTTAPVNKANVKPTPTPASKPATKTNTTPAKTPIVTPTPKPSAPPTTSSVTPASGNNLSIKRVYWDTRNGFNPALCVELNNEVDSSPQGTPRDKSVVALDYFTIGGTSYKYLASPAYIHCVVKSDIPKVKVGDVVTAYQKLDYLTKVVQNDSTNSKTVPAFPLASNVSISKTGWVNNANEDEAKYCLNYHGLDGVGLDKALLYIDGALAVTQTRQSDYENFSAKKICIDASKIAEYGSSTGGNLVVKLQYDLSYTNSSLFRDGYMTPLYSPYSDKNVPKLGTLTSSTIKATVDGEKGLILIDQGWKNVDGQVKYCVGFKGGTTTRRSIFVKFHIEPSGGYVSQFSTTANPSCIGAVHYTYQTTTHQLEAGDTITVSEGDRAKSDTALLNAVNSIYVRTNAPKSASKLPTPAPKPITTPNPVVGILTLTGQNFTKNSNGDYCYKIKFSDTIGVDSHKLYVGRLDSAHFAYETRNNPACISDRHGVPIKQGDVIFVASIRGGKDIAHSSIAIPHNPPQLQLVNARWVFVDNKDKYEIHFNNANNHKKGIIVNNTQWYTTYSATPRPSDHNGRAIKEGDKIQVCDADTKNNCSNTITVGHNSRHVSVPQFKIVSDGWVYFDNKDKYQLHYQNVNNHKKGIYVNNTQWYTTYSATPRPSDHAGRLIAPGDKIQVCDADTKNNCSNTITVPAKPVSVHNGRNDPRAE